ncbi:hypothetical protein [Pseudomarimonas salicorniae]|uniref:Uncharacterized protein n=1 Tax=Pseudomarimonas salicorniae TaxID=2933270 RepID=A0ABT0GKQ6_9GAMM|nr:hypothetical protein [Lysobacter sp. CAU 1642]MCK7594962.1 hypothetical protein [Lysobacter sp. CAU 1642]
MKGSHRLLAIPMALLAIAGLGLIAFYVSPGNESAFKENMVPQLIGFCMEGFFLVGLLSLLQKSQERRQRRELWLSLRGALRGFLSKLDIALLPPHAEPAPTVVLETDLKIVTRFLRELPNSRLEIEDMVALKREGTESLGLARDMIPVAAQLSARHMRWWIAIVNSMRQLAQARSRESVEAAVYLMLENICEFDNVEL